LRGGAENKGSVVCVVTAVNADTARVLPRNAAKYKYYITFQYQGLQIPISFPKKCRIWLLSPGVVEPGLTSIRIPLKAKIISSTKFSNQR
jgi:hypothetical protein